MNVARTSRGYLSPQFLDLYSLTRVSTVCWLSIGFIVSLEMYPLWGTGVAEGVEKAQGKGSSGDGVDAVVTLIFQLPLGWVWLIHSLNSTVVQNVHHGWRELKKWRKGECGCTEGVQEELGCQKPAQWVHCAMVTSANAPTPASHPKAERFHSLRKTERK